MLVAVQTLGNRPPLFFVHGLHGIMPLRPSLAAVLGPDQPFFIIHANGIDGRRPVIDNIRDMVLAYIDEIQAARPTGPLFVASMCAGSLAAIEIARELRQRGREIGPVILADPPLVPLGHKKRQHAVDPDQPQVAQHLYQDVRRALMALASLPYNDMPFNPGDPDQLHHCTLAGIGSLIALTRHAPAPFSGPAELIVSAERAAGFFHPEMPWCKLLPGPRMVHVLPWSHEELFWSGRMHVARMIKFMLEQEAPVLQSLDGQKEPLPE